MTFLARVVLLSVGDRYAKRPGWDSEEFYRGLLEDAQDQVSGGPAGSTTYVIMDGQRRVGRLRLVRTAENIEIAGLQVLPDHQGHGIGSAVVGQVFREASASTMPTILEVELDNPRAQHLYERLGFVATTIVDHDRRRMIRTATKTVPWQSDGWRDEVEQWASEQAQLLGRQPTGSMTEESIQAWSAVWRMPTDAGAVLIKQTTPARAHEGMVTNLCAQLAPQQIDVPLAIDTEGARMLLEDGGSTIYSSDHEHRGLESDTVLAIVTDYGRFQRATSTLADWPDTFPRWDPSTAGEDALNQAELLHSLPDDDPRHISSEQYSSIAALRSQLNDTGRTLTSSPIPEAVDQGDLWPGNILTPSHGSGYRFIDFGDAAWTHPFLSMRMLILECQFRWSVPEIDDTFDLDHPILRAVMDAYLRTWADFADLPSLRTIMDAAVRLAPLRRSRAWITNLGSADDATVDELGYLPWSWLSDVLPLHTDES